jgi:hypothetical protein
MIAAETRRSSPFEAKLFRLYSGSRKTEIHLYLLLQGFRGGHGFPWASREWIDGLHRHLEFIIVPVVLIHTLIYLGFSPGGSSVPLA